MSRSPKPSERRSAAIGPLAVLPLFHKLDGRPVLAAGGSEAMAWKLELLLAAGARPTVAADTLSAEVREIVDAHGLPRMELAQAMGVPGRFGLIVADLPDEADALKLFESARQQGVPINQIDRPAYCTVQFGSIVNRSPAIVAVSTDGAAPVLGQAIRTRIEALLPRSLGDWAEAARAMRPRLAAEIELPSLRRAWWRRFADRALSARSGPNPSDLMMTRADDTPGRVTLVGAGPGDPDLLTVKAIRALQDADVVLYDALISDEVLELARREARRMPVGKRGGRRSCKQEEINSLMIRFAREGRHVVRLKGGDTAIFSRGGEEIRALEDLGIPVSIVPGITTASAASAHLGLTLTDREKGRQLLFVSGHGRGGEAAAIDWRAVASETTTVALYMGRGRIADFAEQAMAHGARVDLPLSIGANISRPDEAWVHTTLACAATDQASLPPDAPILVLAGEVLSQAAGKSPAATQDERRRKAAVQAALAG